MNKHFVKKIGLSAAAILSSAQASAYDWSAMTGAVDFSGEIIGVVAVVGVIAGVLVVRKGASYILGALK